MGVNEVTILVLSQSDLTQSVLQGIRLCHTVLDPVFLLLEKTVKVDVHSQYIFNVNAALFLNLFEAPADFARVDHLSPEYKNEVLARIRDFLKRLGRPPVEADIQQLSRMMAIVPQDIQTMVHLALTGPGDTPAHRAMVPA